MIRIELNKREFVNALTVGGAFSWKSKALPILNCVKIKVKNGMLYIVSSDGENAISKKMPIGIADGEAEFCVNGKDIISYVKLIKSDTLIMEVDTDKGTMKIEHTEGNITMQVQDSMDFPTTKLQEVAYERILSAPMLYNWLVDARKFCSNDLLNPVLSGVYLYSDGNEMGCCGADLHSLFWDKESSDNDGKFDIIVPNGVVPAVCQAIHNDDSVTLQVCESMAVFKTDTISVVSSLVKGKYPNVKAVVPSNTPISVTVNTKQLADALVRSAVSVTNDFRYTILDINEGNIGISVENVEVGKKSSETVSAEGVGSIRIAVNSNKLINTLSAISTDNVVIKFSEPSRPIVVTEQGNDDKIMLTMPLQMRN